MVQSNWQPAHRARRLPYTPNGHPQTTHLLISCSHCLLRLAPSTSRDRLARIVFVWVFCVLFCVVVVVPDRESYSLFIFSSRTALQRTSFRMFLLLPWSCLVRPYAIAPQENAHPHHPLVIWKFRGCFLFPSSFIRCVFVAGYTNQCAQRSRWRAVRDWRANILPCLCARTSLIWFEAIFSDFDFYGLERGLWPNREF